MTAVTSATPSSAFQRVSGRRKFTNSSATVLVTLAFLIALVPLIWLLGTVISKGWRVLAHAGWWSANQRSITYQDAGGGVVHAVIGTLEQVALCTVISVPIAILVGVYLVEYGRGPIAKLTTFMVDIMTGIPSIVAALFIYAVFISTLHTTKAGWLVSLSLVLLMVPVIVRTTEEMLKLVPNELREASYALGVVKWKTIMRVVLPAAMSGLITGVVLGVARVAGETAPLLILGPYSANTNYNVFDGNQAALPTMINEMFLNLNRATGSGAYHLDANGNRVTGAATNFAPERMWGTALTLILLILVLNLLARFIGRFNKVAN
ncbi:MAG TPA: phosphate ABC transporter permease PstA [Jatrophihabitans sp.]|jgi:phosphate transport system permease protein